MAASSSCFPSPHHGASGRVRRDPPLAAIMDLYRRKYLGIDMVLKTLCYAMRLRLLYTADAGTQKYLQDNIMAIIDCRMLCNSMKEPGTAKAALHAWRSTVAPAQTQAQLVLGLLQVGSFAFRVGENLFGDLGYLQKNWFNNWDRFFLSNNYKMFKTFSLVCCAILEIVKLRPAFRRLFAACVRAYHRTHSQVRGHVRRLSSRPEDLDGLDRSGSIIEETASIISSPVAASPIGISPVQSKPIMMVPDASELMLPPRAPLGIDIVSETRKPQVRSALFLLRNIADIIVYSQWISWYNPPKTLEYSCGLLSGTLGVLLVWCDTYADATDRNRTE